MDVDLKKVCVKNIQEMLKHSDSVSAIQILRQETSNNQVVIIFKFSQVNTLTKKDDRLGRDNINEKSFKEKIDRLKVITN